jgi:cupin fold WbuC family metalloprotein
MLRAVTQAMIDELMVQAAASPRRRVIYRLHEHEELVQRMVNALMPGTYVTPHKHENPDKVELFSILVGRVACIEFDGVGSVREMLIMDANGPVRMVEIVPRTYHALVALAPSALVEIIQGPYDARTHKQFAPWAPLEDDPAAADYLRKLEDLVTSRQK